MRCPECGSGQPSEKFVIWRPVTGDRVCDSRFHDDDWDRDGEDDGPSFCDFDDRPTPADNE